MSVGIARIWLDGIEIGSLPQDVYDGIDHDVRRDWRLYVVQALDWSRAIVRFATKAMVRSIFLWTVLAMASIVFAPDTAAEGVQQLAQASATDVVRTLRVCVFLFALTAFCVGFITLILNPESVLPVSAFKRAVNWRIRELLEVPAQGGMTIRFEHSNVCE